MLEERNNVPRVAPSLRNKFFKRKRTCPFSGPHALPIDYKDVRTLSKFVSPERGKIMARRISSVSAKKQRLLKVAIKRARFLALLPYVRQ
jgi:small subunit ribosomal protein S18